MPGQRVGLQSKELPFPGPQVTWAGEFAWPFKGDLPQAKYLGFALDDGSIRITDMDGKTIGHSKAPQNLESINGVAFADGMMAVSTPAEILVSMLTSKHDEPRSFPFDQGAHGVIATRQGGFMAPMGSKGVLHLQKQSDEILSSDFRLSRQEIYFYRMASVGVTGNGAEIIACAGRRHGLVTIFVDSEGRPETIGMSKGQSQDGVHAIDIVDVCPLPSSECPFAVVALGIDNTLHFTSDIRTENPSIGLRLQEMRGTGYTLLAAKDDLFVLTSEEFYVLPGLGARFLAKEPFIGSVAVFRHPIQALDCSMAYGELILLIKEGSVAVFEIDRLVPDLTLPPVKVSGPSVAGELDGVGEMTPDIVESTWDLPSSYVLEQVH